MQIAIVLYPGMTALDAVGPYEVLRLLPDAEVRFVGATPGPVVADSGVLFLGVTHSYAETPEPDIVLVPDSGPRTATTMADKQLTDWLRRVHQTMRWTTPVCTGAMILAAAGILDGLPATTHWMVQPELAAMGAKEQRGQRIVHAGKIATAAGVSAGIDLGLWLAGEVAGQKHAETIQLYIEYDPQPPFDAAHPSKASKTVVDNARTLGRKIALNHPGARGPDHRLATRGQQVPHAAGVVMNGTAVMVGGGIGGLAIAGGLTRASWQVTVLEWAEAFTEVGAGIGLEPNAVKSLNWLGLQVKLRALAMAQGTAGLRTWCGRWPVRSRVEVLRERYGVPAYGLHRADLLQLLMDAPSDADLRTGQRVTGMVQHDWSGEFANQRITELRREGDRRRLVSRLPDRTTGRHRDRPPGALRLAGRHGGRRPQSWASNQGGSHADTASS